MLSRTPDTIVTFGDSLSDAGAVLRLSDRLLADPLTLPVQDALLATPGYAAGFSNGPVHPERLAALLDATLAGYATGAARVLGTQHVEEVLGDRTELIDPALPEAERTALLEFDLNLGAQLDRFIGGAPPFPGGQAPLLAEGDTVLATVFVGLNDFGDFIADALDDPFGALLGVGAFLAEMTGAARAAIRKVEAAAPVDQVAVYTLPSPDFFPIPDGIEVPAFAVALIDGLIGTYNTTLYTTTLRLALFEGADTVVVQTDRITAEIARDPATFGFLATGPYYFGDGTDPEIDLAAGEVSFEVNPAVADLPLRQIVFFDSLHPTAATHGILGAFGAASMTKATAFLGDGADIWSPRFGADLVMGGDGDDTIHLGGGADVGLGGLGNDTLTGASGRDIVSGGSGDDELRGGWGNDFLAGGPGDDVLRGGAGWDIFVDGRGSDTIHAHAGDDTMIWVDPMLTGGPDGATDLFLGGRGVDTLYLVTDGTTAEAIRLEMAERSADDHAVGRWIFEEIGVTARWVESVVLLTGGIDDLAPEAGLIGTADAELYAQGALWGFV